MASSNIKAVILGGLQQVWELILDIENYATWRHIDDGNLIWKTAI